MRLRDECGFDIRATLDLKNKPKGKGRTPYVYRIVGRYKWNGGYVSFINPDDYADEFEQWT